MNEMRGLPSVDQLLKTEKATDLIAEFGRPLTVKAIRKALDEKRQSLKKNPGSGAIVPDAFLIEAQNRLSVWLQPSLQPVINATGVILHTNLGRAPVSAEALTAIAAASSGYSTLEFNLATGQRGKRGEQVEDLLKLLTSAEAALVVNNNAAALLLCLSAVAKKKRVIVARSQMVEVGGGFRIPDVMNQSGARLVEVGTTNRVHDRDFEEALDEPAGLVMRAHHSNFKIVGFTTEPELAELVRVAHAKGVPVLDDLGSGALIDSALFGLAHEPTVQESLEAGADLVCFSGDKLLGGPQAGIILGRTDLVAKLRKHPLARAVRADKLCLAGLAVTLTHYLKDEAVRKIPVWMMVSMPVETIRQRAENWRTALQQGEIVPGYSTVGGGSLPEETLPTWLLAVESKQPNRFLSRLRASQPAVIARILDDRVVLDPRTVLLEQEAALLSILSAILSK